MRRVSLIVSVLAVVPLGLAVLARTGPAAVQATTPTAEGHGFVGSWRFTVTPAQGPPLPPFFSLATLGADGTMVVAPPSVVQPPGPGGVVFVSPGHGAWESTGSDTAIFTFMDHQFDGQGKLDGSGTVRAAISLGADGQTWHGEYVRNFYDAAGNTVATIQGSVQATRIVAEAPAMPATPGTATPTT